MIYFSSRAAARRFADKGGKKVSDCGVSCPVGRRWAVKVV